MTSLGAEGGHTLGTDGCHVSEEDAPSPMGLYHSGSPTQTESGGYGGQRQRKTMLIELFLLSVE